MLCREFDISRKTGYKIFTRYKNCGMVAGAGSESRRLYTRTVCAPPAERYQCDANIAYRLTVALAPQIVQPIALVCSSSLDKL
jgi:hypothetical protein